MELLGLIKKAMGHKASDVHLVTGLPVSLRIAGEIVTLDGELVSEAQVRAMAESTLDSEQRQRFERDKQVCFSLILEGVAHVRISFYTRLGRVEAAIRLRAFDLPSLEELGLPPTVAELTRRPNGLILITGPTGVGKTTSFYSMLERINSERREKIITIEDPIEYLFLHKRSIIIQQEIGRDAITFDSALMHILRLDPDIIGIGELRDSKTISAALLAAETGHLVIATLHTTSAAQTMERIITALPMGERDAAGVQLASCLRGVITQQLLPTVDAKARVLAYEVLIANAAVRNNIREGKYAGINDVIQSGGDAGMKSLDMCLRELYQGGRISYDTASIYARDPRMLRPGEKRP